MSFPQAALVVLAAGASRRLGRPKQHLELGGRSLLGRTLHVVQRVPVATRVLVLGAHDAPRDAPLEGVHVVQNQLAHEGMASSLRLGLRTALAHAPALEAVLFTVCDQPFLGAELLCALLRAVQDECGMSAASYDGVLGVPAAFGRAHFAALEALRGDEGARRLLRAEPQRVSAVPFPRGDVDIDVAADLARVHVR